ncbi:hypothetical protein B0H14DRAFT_3474826 [Mycena olivaceomarginata]|nr:hypothetical protein B0H14DRAFT_3474826 [Mycena olivaceomarginata]
MSDFRLALVEAEQGLPGADLERWTKEMELWEDDPANPNPFKVAERPEDIFAIRKQLVEDVEGARVGDAADNVRGDLHAHEMINMGMQLEEQQRALQWDSGAVKLHATGCQKTALLEHSNKLGRKITEWLKIHESFAPIVVPLRKVDDQARATTARLQAPPALPVHAIKLMPGMIVKESHARMEFALRIRKAEAALGELRRLLLVRMVKWKHKDMFTRGVTANTRAKVEYRAARVALTYLGPVLKETQWKLKLQTLAPDDLTDEEGFQGGMVEALRLEWAKTRARAWRWTEEVDLLKQEMDQVGRFLRWKETWWMEIQDQRLDNLKFSAIFACLGVIPVETQHGEGDEEDEDEPIPETARDSHITTRPPPPPTRHSRKRPGGGHTRCARAQKGRPPPPPVESAPGAGTSCARAPKERGHLPAPGTVKSAPGPAIPAAPGPKNGGATRPPPPPVESAPGAGIPAAPGSQKSGATRPPPPQSKAHRERPYQLHPAPVSSLSATSAGRTLSSTVGSSVSTLTTTLSGTFWLTLLSLPKLFGALSGLPAFIWSFVAAPLVSLPVPNHKMAAIRQTLLMTARLTRAGHIAEPNHFQKYDRLCMAFFAKRNRLRYSGDGPGLIYIVASFKKPDSVPSFKKPDGVAWGPDMMHFLAQLNIKGVLTQPDWMERRHTEYRKCEEDNTHMWICTYEVSRRLYCERLLHLTLLCDGVTRDRTPCKCGVSHREYFNFLSIGGLSRLHATTVSVLKLMGEPIRRKFFLPSDDTKAVYDLIRAT